MAHLRSSSVSSTDVLTHDPGQSTTQQVHGSRVMGKNKGATGRIVGVEGSGIRELRRASSSGKICRRSPVTRSSPG